MPSSYYKRSFEQGYYYHIYNRGAFKNAIYEARADYVTFIEIIRYYISYPTHRSMSETARLSNKVPNLGNSIKPSFDLVAFCLMPNHFHLLFKKTNNYDKATITNFMRRITITYSMFHKKKYNRSGTLFEGKYKNILVKTDSQLKHLSRYIHRNPEDLQGSEPCITYPYSSYQYYCGLVEIPHWINSQHIMALFDNNPRRYKSFVEKTPYTYKIADRHIA